MSKPSHTIVDMAEVWDELTPRQQQFMIQRAKTLAGRNRMEAKGLLSGTEMHQMQSGSTTAKNPDKETKAE